MTRSIAALLFAVVAIGCGKKTESEKPRATPSCPTCVIADEHGFNPTSLDLPKGPPGSKATVTFTRTTDKTCATEVVMPDLSITKPLPLNQPVAIEVPNDSARTLNFQCGMAMYKGKLVVQ